MKKHLPFLALATLTACASTPPAVSNPITYACGSGPISSIQANYTSNDAILQLSSDANGTSHTLKRTSATNGTRYTSARTNPARTGDLVWYINNSQAILYTVTPSQAPRYTYEKQTATCTLQN